MRKAAIPAAALLLIGLAATPANAVDKVNSKKLRDAVTVNGILGHERVLQRIANQNGGTRASGTAGFTASATYVKDTLRAAGYRISEQEFTFPFFRDLAPATLSAGSTSYPTDTFTYSGSGTVTGALVPTTDVQVPPPATPGVTSGCEASDFPPAGDTPAVALIQRGTCTFAVKASNAVAAGYDAVIIFNEGQTGRTALVTGDLGQVFGIPIVGLSYDDGAALVTAAKAGPVTVTVTTSTETDLDAKTSNILAETPGGDPDKVLVVGAHLDSVVDGPGINDNGSGLSTTLEIAKQLSALKVKPRQKVRFAFWGAEEGGLLGSEHYVDTLPDADLAKIFANLNFDMVGSPNYVRFAYDGDGSAFPASTGPAGSGEIEAVFHDYFTAQGLASGEKEFNGRSDYGPFIAVGIPAGGLSSGSDGVKTAAEAEIYGGTAGIIYDPCYHKACDTINNVSTKALAELGDGAAHGIYTLAMTKSGLFPDGSLRAATRTPMPVAPRSDS
ncbi:M20/M25/M40 family metallo-hydrolase [Actinoplanes sp. NPDC026619]|uniref:M20/M25/M40 family metallo-hydrolase n=1 Tax=Actinoplanes sp. NPDC026619 TaxID=3155798 RepID=UPI0033D6CD0E